MFGHGVVEGVVEWIGNRFAGSKRDEEAEEWTETLKDKHKRNQETVDVHCFTSQ